MTKISLGAQLEEIDRELELRRKVYPRLAGINAGHAWMRVADACVVHTDRGISEGMRAGICLAEFLKLPVEYRSLTNDRAVLR